MGRWTDYYLDPDFDGFWSRRVTDSNRKILVILAVGFDPRCLATLEKLSKFGLQDRLGYLAMKLDPRPPFGQSDTVIEKYSAENMKRLESLAGCRREGLHEITTHDDEGHNIVGRRTLNIMSQSMAILKAYTDIIVDISGMPRGAFFPLLAYLVHLAETGEFQNLHVSIVEDSGLDTRITGREYGQADYLHTFRHQGEDKIIWLPLLGDSEVTRLEKIHNRIKGACIEICPILPFPAKSLRRVDDVAVRHAELLFEGLLVSADNLILCDERNPFDVYRKILEIEDYYRVHLGTIPAMGKVTTVVSPLSSKSLSLGMLLAAIERKLPVCHVEAGAYSLETNGATEVNYFPTEIWIAGEPYT